MLTPELVLLVVGTALVISFLGYSVYSAISGLTGVVSVANVFSAIAMLGVVVILGATLLGRWRRARKAVALVGFVLLGSFVGYALYNATDTYTHHRTAGNAFAVAGMSGLLLLLAAGALQRIRS